MGHSSVRLNNTPNNRAATPFIHNAAAGHVYCQSCESMRGLDDGVMALTVTSPPYYRAIDYNTHVADDGQNYRRGTYAAVYETYEEYLGWLQRIFLGEVWRVTRPGGFCAIVVGTILINGRHYPLHADVTKRLTDGGWRFHEQITWHKTTAGVRRAGSAIQNPFPGNFYANIMTEEIIIFRKPGPRIGFDKALCDRVGAKFPIDELFVRDIANNLWNIPPVPPKFIKHPCPFPEEIPHRLIQLYSYPGDEILDPFCGSGQVLKVARAHGRRWVGYEIVPEYVELARRRVTEPLHLREMQLVTRFEKIPLGVE